MKTLIFEFEKPLKAIEVYAFRINEQKYIELIGMFEIGASLYKGFKCPEDRARDAKKLFDNYNIKFTKVDEIKTDTSKYIHVKLQEPLDCVLLKMLPPIPLKSAEYRQIEKKEFLQAFRCTLDEFESIEKAFEELNIGFRVY